MMTGQQIADEPLAHWRKLAQGMHARYVVADIAAAARFVTAIGEAADALAHYSRVSLGAGYVDIKQVSADAI